MDFVSLLWIAPAISTAVPMVGRLLPFKLPERAYPLFYFLIALVCFFLPCRVDLALGAAGLISLLHLRLGESLAKIDPPDMSAVANSLALAWDHMVLSLPRLLVIPVNGKAPSIDEPPKDDKSEDEHYQEPPRPPEDKIPPAHTASLIGFRASSSVDFSLHSASASKED